MLVVVTSVDAGCSWGLSVELGLGFCCTCWVVAAGCACFFSFLLILEHFPGRPLNSRAELARSG